MSNIAIKVENLSKAYQLGEIGTGTISRDIERWIAKLRGKEDPFLKIGEANDRTTKGGSDIVWSLKDLDFEINQGDAVGIIGRNGAGKSTLLKLLSRVTAPTAGTIKVKGRIASLLEVGTGFHPELTGRENIYLNGAILGMRKKEIDRKFDEIVDFSGVERYIDTPVKRYSSGMYVRLAFAVAAHLESEILIVDEVLAVGDAEFQKKCLGKMGDVSKGEGRTVLFVSHNMAAVNQLCNKGIILQKGMLSFTGSRVDAVNKYLSDNVDSDIVYKGTPKESPFYIDTISLLNENDAVTNSFLFNEPVTIALKINVKTFLPTNKISVTLQNNVGDFLSTFVVDIQEHHVSNGICYFKIRLDDSLIAPNSYFFRIAIFNDSGALHDLVEMACPFRIFDSGTPMAKYEGNNYGYFFMNHNIIQ